MQYHPDGPRNYTDRMKQRLDNTRVTQMQVKSFDVKIAEGEPVLGLGVEPVSGASFIIPIAFETAKALANLMLQTLMFEAPELFFPADVAQEFGAGRLSLEQLKELI